MRFACSSEMTPGETFGDKLAFLERAGYEGIELRLLESEATRRRIGQIMETLDASTVCVSSVVLPGPAYRLPFNSEEARLEKLALAKKAVRIAAKLGAGALITPEYQPQPLALFRAPRGLSDNEHDLFMGFLQDLAEYAEQASGIAMLEPINRYESRFYHTLEEAVSMCQRVGSDRLKVVADFFHMNIEEPNIAAGIEAAGKHIYHVQLGDSNRLLPGRGHIDFESGFAALRRVGYHRYAALECRIPDNPERDLPACACYLHQRLAAAARIRDEGPSSDCAGYAT